MTWPIGAADWEMKAKESLGPAAFDFIAGGACTESTMRANLESFDRWRLLPRMLAGNATVDLDVDVLGTHSNAPFLIAPIGVQGIAHADGEVASARAAAAQNIPFIFSTTASRGLEEVAEAMGAAARWFQLYWISDREIAASFVSRALNAGYTAIVLTVDAPTFALRDRDLRNGYVPFLSGQGIGNFTSDPIFRARLSRPPEADIAAAGAEMVTLFPNLALNWSDLAWLRERIPVPLLLKGILTAEDARLAVEAGIDGVIVSNHGGRQVDGAVATLDALPEVRAAVGQDVTVLMDGGIRRGPDVVKALALGADAVLLGRPHVFGLAAGGQAGVEQVIAQLRAEIENTLRLIGVSAASQVGREYVKRLP